MAEERIDEELDELEEQINERTRSGERGGGGNYVCEECGQRFAMPSELNEHKRETGHGMPDRERRSRPSTPPAADEPEFPGSFAAAEEEAFGDFDDLDFDADGLMEGPRWWRKSDIGGRLSVIALAVVVGLILFFTMGMAGLIAELFVVVLYFAFGRKGAILGGVAGGAFFLFSYLQSVLGFYAVSALSLTSIAGGIALGVVGMETDSEFLRANPLLSPGVFAVWAFSGVSGVLKVLEGNILSMELFSFAVLFTGGTIYLTTEDGFVESLKEMWYLVYEWPEEMFESKLAFLIHLVTLIGLLMLGMTLGLVPVQSFMPWMLFIIALAGPLALYIGFEEGLSSGSSGRGRARPSPRREEVDSRRASRPTPSGGMVGTGRRRPPPEAPEELRELVDEAEYIVAEVWADLALSRERGEKGFSENWEDIEDVRDIMEGEKQRDRPDPERVVEAIQIYLDTGYKGGLPDVDDPRGRLREIQKEVEKFE